MSCLRLLIIPRRLASLETQVEDLQATVAAAGDNMRALREGQTRVEATLSAAGLNSPEAGSQVQQALDRANSAAVQQGSIQSELRAAERGLQAVQEQMRAQERKLQVAAAQQQPAKVVVHCNGSISGEEIVGTLASHAGVAKPSIRSAIRLSSRGSAGARAPAGDDSPAGSGSTGQADGSRAGDGGRQGGGSYAAAAVTTRRAESDTRAVRSTWLLEVASPAVQRAILGQQCRTSLHAAGVRLFVERPLTEAEQRQRKAQQPRVRQLAAAGVRTRWRGATLQQHVGGAWADVLPGPPPSPNRQQQQRQHQQQAAAGGGAA